MHTMESRRTDRSGVPSRHRRRWSRLAAVIGVVGLMAAACGDPEPTTNGDPGLGSSANFEDVIIEAEGEPREGGTLRVGLDAETPGFNATADRWAGAGLTIGRSIYDPLATIGADGKPKPFLAESFTPSDDYRTWDIKVRPNITFHDGTPLDAEAVRNWLDTYRNSATVGSALRPVESVEVVDPLTVRLQMNQPWGTFPIVLVVQPGYVAAPSQLADPEASLKPVGTGPFVFESWQPNRALVVKKNPNYWREGIPKLDAIDFRPIKEDQARYNALQSGDVDVIISPREPSIQRLARDGQAGTFQVVRAKGDNDVNMWMLNVSKAPFDDLRLRQAMAHGIDRSQILALTDSPEELAADSIYAKDSPWYVDPDYPKYDPAKAKALVAEIEAEKGPVKVTLTAVPDPDLESIIQVMQAQLAEVGIEVTIKSIEQTDLINTTISGDYEAVTWRQFGSTDPDGNYLWFHSSNADPPLTLNMARNKNPKIDEAIETGRASADPEVRKEAYATLQKELAKDLPYLFTTHLRWTMGASNKVRGLEAVTLPDDEKGSGLISAIMPLNELWLVE
jgi:peptide/nickel transport system substrate-binding protein